MDIRSAAHAAAMNRTRLGKEMQRVKHEMDQEANKREATNNQILGGKKAKAPQSKVITKK